jgi:crotonobetainyl-CoA:carnitine CoA-transferase CaiB-like acyl-CoA transferase
VAITGHGWCGDVADRVAFGDDAAAAGGLVRWTAKGEPRFVGDAIADPLTGLAATLGALAALGQGGGFLVDAALARVAAQACALTSLGSRGRRGSAIATSVASTQVAATASIASMNALSDG